MYHMLLHYINVKIKINYEPLINKYLIKKNK